MERRKDLTGRNSFKLVKQGERGISQKREQENWKKSNGQLKGFAVESLTGE
jgi:hypothetical protein